MNQSSSPGLFSTEQRALLTSVLNVLIPARGELPGAGDLGIGDVVERAGAGGPALRRLIVDALAAVQAATGRQAGVEFAALDLDGQEQVLCTVEATAPFAFAALLNQTYRGYYTNPRVHAAIGYDGRPPQPRGYSLPPFEPAQLEHQRQREPFWRPAPS